MVEATRNLTVPRGDKSVWDKPSLTAKLSTYDQERWMAVACAAALTTMGARRGGFRGLSRPVEGSGAIREII